MSARTTTLDGTLPATALVGGVALTVLDLRRAIRFYENVIGLTVRQQASGSASLGTADRELVRLVEEPAARRATRHHAGMYHFCLLFESREDLANVVARVIRARVPVDGASDHHTHEALYLPDPDGNGIELAWDRPRQDWPGESAAEWFGLGIAPLDADGLLALVRDGNPTARAGDGLRIGHVHLHVSSLEESIAFYVDALGFDLQVELGGTAVFVSAGGYHHHVGFNIWRGNGVAPAPAPESVAGLREWTLRVGDSQQLDAVRERLSAGGYSYKDQGTSLIAADPAGIRVRVAAD
ncbi:MAG TPA: VOC family protein [Baekduia sp.]|nr:VOC family protein [Baekduia sp.]